jgi:hypothetical protein
MNRHDAVNIIDHALAQQKSEKSSRSNGEGSSSSQTRSKSIARRVEEAGRGGRGEERECVCHNNIMSMYIVHVLLAS